MEGYEADNLIVTYARPALGKSMEAAVASAYKDLMQLIRPGLSFTIRWQYAGFYRRYRRHYGHPAKRPPRKEAFFNDGFLKKRALHFKPASFFTRQARRETSPSWPEVRDISSINRRKHSASGLRRLRIRRI